MYLCIQKSCFLPTVSYRQEETSSNSFQSENRGDLIENVLGRGDGCDERCDSNNAGRVVLVGLGSILDFMGCVGVYAVRLNATHNIFE